MDTIVKLHANMMAGEIPVAPIQKGKTDTCKYCPYKAICHIGDKRNGMHKRRVKSMGYKDYVAKLREDEKEGE